MASVVVDAPGDLRAEDPAVGGDWAVIVLSRLHGSSRVAETADLRAPREIIADLDAEAAVRRV